MSSPSFNDYTITEMSAHRSGTLADIPLSRFTQLIAANLDNSETTVSLDFPFVFEGEPFSSVRVSTNGVVQLIGGGTTLLGTHVTSNDPSNIQFTSWTDPVLAPWWADMKTADTVHRGGVYSCTRNLGFGGHQETIFRFVCYSSTANTSVSAYVMTFEVSLNSLNGISFRYAPIVQVDVPFSSTGLIGIGMKARNGVARYRYIKGDFLGSLTVTDDWPMRLNFERCYLITPPKRLVVSATPVSNVRITR